MSEELKLQLEYEKLLNEKYRTHLERWNTDIEPLEKARIISREMANDFAKTSIKTIFLLNGGGLLALPTFFKSDFIKIDNGKTLIFCAAFYVTGLLFSAIVNVLGALSLDFDKDCIFEKIEVIKCDLNASENKEKRAQFEANSKIHLEKQTKYFKKSILLKNYAILFWVLALVVFTTGSLYAISALEVTPQLQNIEIDKK